MASSAATILACVSICSFVIGVWSLKCYSCNQTYVHGQKGSEDNYCFDEAFEQSDQEQGHFCKDNNTQCLKSLHQCKVNQTQCLKSLVENYDIEPVTGNKVIVSRMVVRRCALETEYTNYCEYNKGSASYSYICFCDSDQCNSASVTSISITAFILAALLALFR